MQRAIVRQHKHCFFIVHVHSTDLSVGQRRTISAAVEARFDDVARPRLEPVAAPTGSLARGPLRPRTQLAVARTRYEAHLFHEL